MSYIFVSSINQESFVHQLKSDTGLDNIQSKEIEKERPYLEITDDGIGKNDIPQATGQRLPDHKFNVPLAGSENTTLPSTGKNRYRNAKVNDKPFTDEEKASCQNIYDNVLRSTSESRHNFMVVTPSTSIAPYDVTLITQLSCDRIKTFQKLLRNWQGPVSVAIYCNKGDAEKLLQEKFWSHKQYHKLTINMVYEVSRNDVQYYPVNYLRNIAVSSSQTEYIFFCDVDFIPSYGLHNYLVKAASAFLKAPSVKRALVVAAFEEIRVLRRFPGTKKQLQLLFETKVVSRFHARFSGHKPTNYTEYFAQSFPYRVNWKLDYEPYLVVRKSSVPRYDESFVGYGFNKIIQIAELNAMKFEFIVLPQEFLIHLKHPVSKDSVQFKDHAILYKCMKYNYIQYIRNYLPSKYGERWKYGNERKPFTYHVLL